MFRSIVLLVGGLASLWANSLPAQDAILGQKYGQGVHAYFSGDYSQAFEQLTAAIEGGSKDPRAFYFRGLTYLQFGRPQEAKQDFQKGADLESRDVNKFYDVSKALERVQGPARTELENYRVEARMAVMQQVERLRKARYEAIQREESRVLRELPPAPPEPIKTPEPAAEPAAETAADPFAAPEEKPAPKAGMKAGQAGQETGRRRTRLRSLPKGLPTRRRRPSRLPAKIRLPPRRRSPPPNRPPARRAASWAPWARRWVRPSSGQADKAPAAEEKPADAANPFGEEPAAAEEAAAEEAGQEAGRQEAAEKKANPDDPFAQ